MNHYDFDLEVFKYGWLASFKNTATGEFHDFINAPEDLREWIDGQKMVVCGFNNKHYDNHILKAMYHGFSIEDIKDLNDFIIVDGGQGWEWSRWNYHKQPFEAYDIRDDLPITLSLKEIAGNLGLSIVESPVPFDLDRPLTDEEWDEVIKYCHMDIDVVTKIRKIRNPYLESKVYVGKLANLIKPHALGLTNAKLTSAYLVGSNAKPKQRGDDTDYQFPKNLEVNNQEILDFYKVIDPTYEARLVTNIAGVEHTLAYGGLHGARPNYIGETTDKRVIVNIDVVSYYPSLMIKNGYVSRAVPEPSDYEKVYQRRIQAKSRGNKDEANGLKLVLNTTYGAMKNKYNALYDALMANSVCISGQLYLIDLIEKLEKVPTFELIQSNTDGIMIAVDREHFDQMDWVVRQWELRTGFKMEFDDVESIHQKDVNNYVMVNTKGDIKVKGGYVSNYEGGSITNASIPIVAKAIVNFFVYHIPPEQTIGEEDDILEFQMIAKTGRTYDKTVHEVDGELIEVQRVNRVYATENTRFGTLYKVKESDNRKDKIANLPERCVIDNENRLSLNDIDGDFYIEMAKKRIEDFLGKAPTSQSNLKYFYHPESDSYWTSKEDEINWKDCDVAISIEITQEQYDEGMRTGKSLYELKNKKEESTMTTKTTKPTVKPTESETPQVSGLARKIFELRKKLSSFVWEKDGKNMHHKYKYISEAQYKRYFEQALEAVGLDFKTDITDVQFIPNVTDKNHLTTIKTEYILIDPETEETRTYIGFGQGADTLDKGIYKAIVGALKYFINSNFLINDNSDPEDDGKEVAPTTRPATTEKRQAVKQEIMDKVEPVTEGQKTVVKTYLQSLKKAGGYEDKIKEISAIMKSSPDKVKVGAIIMELEEIVEELAGL